MSNKRINPVFLVISVLAIVSMVVITLIGNEATAEKSGVMEELSKDSVALRVVVNKNVTTNELQDMSVNYERRKKKQMSGDNMQTKTPVFNIEESNLSEKKQLVLEKDLKAENVEDSEKENDLLGKGTYESPYKNQQVGGANVQTQKFSSEARGNEKEKEKNKSDKNDVEDLFNTSVSSSDNTSKSGGALISKRVRGVIHGDQKVKEGGEVRLRLQEELVVGSVRIPRNTIFTARISSGSSNGRLQLLIQGMGGHNVSGLVLDHDGIEGIKYDQAVENPTEQAGRGVVRQITSDILNRLPGGRYADQLIRTTRSVDGSIYLIDQYKIFVQIVLD